MRRPTLLRHRPDDAAVSSVLGAILVFGLLIATLVSIQVNFVPTWDRERERDQSLRVAQQMGTIKADLERIAFNQTTTPLSEPISLTRDRGFSFFGGAALPGTVRYTPTSSGAGMTVSSANPVALQSSGGESLYGLSEEWTWTGSEKADVLDLVHLRLRIPNPQGLPTGAGSLVMALDDSSGNCVGEVRLVHYGTTGSGKAIEAQVYPARVPAALTCDPNPIDIQYSYIGTAASSPATHYYYYDVLGGPFRQVLAAIPPSQYPLSVSFTQGNTGGQGAIVYDESTPFGPVRTGGAGVVLPSLNQQFQTGTLFVGLNHQRLAAQTYLFEYGALMLEQPDGAAMVGAPGFSVGASTSQGFLDWALPVLQGGSSAVAGSSGAIITMSPTGTGSSMDLAAQDITVTLTTSHGAQWVQLWQDRMALAGLSSAPVAPNAPCNTALAAAPHYVASSTATTATLTFYGPCANPADTTRDVQVSLASGDATIDLRPNG
jgi:hypothetical protein